MPGTSRTGNAPRRTSRAVERLLAECDGLADRELLELHRELSRVATRIRLADPEYQRRYATGVAAAASALRARR